VPEGLFDQPLVRSRTSRSPLRFWRGAASPKRYPSLPGHQGELGKDAAQEEIRGHADSAAANDFSLMFSRGFDRRKRNQLMGQCAVGKNRDDGCASCAGADDASAGIGRKVDIASKESRGVKRFPRRCLQALRRDHIFHRARFPWRSKKGPGFR
jgi:hypothetical protein